jgi:hypothetical protein
MNAVAKRTETKIAKLAVSSMGFHDVSVTHSGHGWLDIFATMAKPNTCFCADVPRNLGRCKDCSDDWYTAYINIKQTVKAATERSGEYDGNIQVKLSLR